MLLYALSLLATREHGGGMDVQHRAVAVIAPGQQAAYDLGVQIAQRDYPPADGWAYDVRALEIAAGQDATVFTTEDDPPRQYDVRVTVAPRQLPGNAPRRSTHPAPPLDETTAVLDEDRRWGGEGG
jgi:hypothetical protein